MQTSAHGIMLDQLQQVNSTTDGASIPSTGNSAGSNALALLYPTLRELLLATSMEHITQTLVEAARTALAMDLCALLLFRDEENHLTMQATSPDLNGQLLAVPPLLIEPALWKKLTATTDRLPTLNANEREQLNPLKNVQYESLHIVALAAGSQCVGLLYCYSSKARDLEQDEQLIAQTIASFAAISITNHRLVNTAASTTSVKSFFDDLLRGGPDLENSLRGRAAALGCNCSLPHVMLVLEIARLVDEDATKEVREEIGEQRQAACRHAFTLAERSLRAAYPCSLFDARENCMYALIGPVEDGGIEDLKKRMDALMQQVESGLLVKLFAGISTVCADLRDYAAGFSEAREALSIAQSLNERAASLSFSDLGAYRYLYPFAREAVRCDHYLEQVAVIARYDQSHKRAGMLNTLEVYLEHWGNIKEVSERLSVHRNTITQRLDRIRSLCSINIEQPDNRLPLHMAILIHKLRAQ